MEVLAELEIRARALVLLTCAACEDLEQAVSYRVQGGEELTAVGDMSAARGPLLKLAIEVVLPCLPTALEVDQMEAYR